MPANWRWRSVRQGLLAGAIVAAILLVFWANQFMAHYRLGLTAVYFVPTAVSSNIVIVALDDQSLEAYGRSPTHLSREVYADLINVLDEAGARVAVFDILFSDLSDDTAGDAALAEAIESARNGDTRLRTVLAAAGVYPASPVVNQDAYPNALHFDSALKPVPFFADEVDYIGYVNTFPDADGSVRRQPSLIEIGDTLSPSLSVAAYLAYLRVPVEAMQQIITYDAGNLHIGQTTVAVNEVGLWQQNFFGPPSNIQKQNFPVVPLVDVLEGAADSTLFDDKIVMIGLLNSTGISDRYAVPSAARGQLMTGVEIQANAIETLLQNRALRQSDTTTEALLIITLAIGASLLYMHLRWYFRVLAASLLVVAGASIAFVLFGQHNLIINIFDPGLSVILPVLVTTGIDITNESTRRRQTEFILQSMVQVTQQRLMMDKILSQLVTNLKSLIPNARVSIWRWNHSEERVEKMYPMETKNTPLGCSLTVTAQQVALSGEPVIKRTQVIYPIAWYDRLIGIFALCTPDNVPISSDSIALLSRLSELLAPSLENAFLYTALEEQSAIQDAILVGSPTGILVTNNAYHIIRLNDAIDTLFDLHAEDYVGRPLSALLEACALDEKQRGSLADALRKRQAFHQHIDIEEKTFSIDVAPLQQVGLWVLMVTEITPLIQLSDLKTHMIRMLSHDLGNPLSRILGYSQLLLHDNAMQSESHQQFLDYIIQDGEEMDRIIVDVLNLEHTRSAEIALEPVDLAAIVRQTLERQEHELSLKQQTHSTDLPDEPVTIEGNTRQLTQAITNLLNNAIKYTPEGGHIDVKLLTTEGDDTIQFVVSDTGYGIPKASQPNIFKEFYRVKSQTTSAIAGTGLGLSLVKVIADAHGGRIWFESEEDVGSTFYLELPILEDYVPA